MRPPSYRQRLFVEPYLGKSSGFAVAAARRAGHPWPEQMDRKMLRFVEKTRNSHTQNAPSEPVGCVELAMTHRPASWLTPRPGNMFAPNVPLAPVLAPHASRPLPSAGNWVRFSCSIPPLFVLSHSMPMINTTDKLALFGAFLSPLAPSLWIHWPLFFRPTPAPAPPAGSGRAQTLPRWLLPDTDSRIHRQRSNGV